MALYLYDAATRTRELLWADPDIACGDPIPVRPRERPPVIASQLARKAANEGRFLLADVYQGLTKCRAARSSRCAWWPCRPRRIRP